MRIVILASGGMDSGVMLAMAKAQQHDVFVLFVDYGQRALTPEYRHLCQLIEYYGFDSFYAAELDRELFRHTGLSTQKHADLTGDPAKLKSSPAEVPFRNGLFASLAATVADSIQFDTVWLGTHRGHSQSGEESLYPDSTPKFITSMAQSIMIGTKGRVQLIAPLCLLYKEDIVKKGEQLGVPWHLTYSCYTGDVPPCGKCLACVDRERALNWDQKSWQS